MSTLVTARRALWCIFFLNGAVLSSWAPRIPAVKEALGLSDAELGVALLGIAAGSVPTLLLTGRLLRCVPARSLCRASAVVFAAALPLIGVVGNLPSLATVLVLLGAASGMLDIAMNAAALGLERAHAVTVLPGLHGGYSLGVLAGAGAGAAVAGSLPVVAHFLLVTGVLLVILAVVWRALPFAPAEGTAPAIRSARRRLGGGAATTGHRPALALVVFALCALLLEGMVTDWSAVLLAQERGASPTVAGLAVTVFSAAMALSRVLADRLAHRVSTAAIARWGAGMAGSALVVGFLHPNPAVLVAALAVAGLGCGPLFPLAISTAGAQATGPVGTTTATLTAWGYLAYLGGPPLVGFTSEHLGLPAALVYIGGLAAVVLCFTALVAVRWRPVPAEQSHPDSLPDITARND